MVSSHSSTEKLRVFLCHSSKDKDVVRQLYLNLYEDGFQPWLDEEDLLPGQDWRREIPLAVKNCHVVMVCFSGNSLNKSGYIQNEISFALDIAESRPEGEIYFIPLRLEECELPERIGRFQWVDLFRPEGYRLLKKSLNHRAKSLAIPEGHKKSVSPDIPAPGGGAVKPYALVMKGGGVKGLAYVGAIEELEKHYRFDWFIGTSAGAIAAVLLGAEYSTGELKSILSEKRFLDFLDAPWYSLPTNLLFKKGLFPANSFTTWIDQLLAEKLESPVRVTLGQLPNRVTIYASRRDRKALIFDSADPATKDVAAAFAVRCSMAIPFIFMPQMDAGLRVLDGGMQNNYPIDSLLQNNPNADFIGLYLGAEHFEGINGEASLVSDILSVWTEANDVEALKTHHKRTLVIDPRPISTLDFSLNEGEKDFLLTAGRSSALKFLLRKSDLPEYTKSAISAESTGLKKTVEKMRDDLTVRRRGKSSFRIRLLMLLMILASAAATTFVWLRREPVDTANSAGRANAVVSSDSPIQPSVTATPARNSITYIFRVTDADTAKAVPNALIAIEFPGQSARLTTDQNGIAEFRPDIPVGRVGIATGAAGFENLTLDLVLTETENQIKLKRIQTGGGVVRQTVPKNELQTTPTVSPTPSDSSSSGASAEPRPIPTAVNRTSASPTQTKPASVNKNPAVKPSLSANNRKKP